MLRCREADAQASMAAMAKRFRNSMLQNIGALVERGTTEADAAVVGEAFRAWSAEVSAAKAPEAGAETAEEARARLGPGRAESAQEAIRNEPKGKFSEERAGRDVVCNRARPFRRM